MIVVMYISLQKKKIKREKNKFRVHDLNIV